MKGTIVTNRINYWSPLEAEFCRRKSLAKQRDACQWQIPQHRRATLTSPHNKLTEPDIFDSSILLDVSKHQGFALELQEVNNLQVFLNYPLIQKMPNSTMPPWTDEDPDSSEAVLLPDSLDPFGVSQPHDMPTLSPSEKSYSSGSNNSFQRRLIRSSTITNSMIPLLYEPLPDNILCWERDLLSNCTLCIPLFPHLKLS